MISERYSISGSFALLCCIWGSTWLAIKIGLESVPPLFAVWIRFLIALPILYMIMRLRGLAIPRDKPSWKLFFIAGLLSFSLPFGLIYWSAQHLPSGLMSILFAIFPLVVAILSHYFLPGEPLTLPKLGGVLLGFAGIVVIFSEGLRWEDGFALFGMGAIIIATVMQASAMIVLKKRAKEISPVTLNFASMSVGVIVLSVMAFSLEDFASIRWDEKAIGSILYLATMGTVVTFVTYYWLLKRVEAVYLSLIAFVTPILAVFLGSVVLHERLQPTTFTGAALVLVGILLANQRGLSNFLRRNREVPIADSDAHP